MPDGARREHRISWTEETWNPVTGCDKLASSRGCDNCYAMTMAKRLNAMGHPKYQTNGDPRTSGPGFGVALHPESLSLPLRWRSPRMVFVNSMSDLFHAKVPLGFIKDVFQVIAETPHTYQVLTKRSLRLRRLAPQLDWPANLWMGVSVEDPSATPRIDHLREVPAQTRFLSIEPLISKIGAINLDGIGWVIVGGESGPRHRPMDPAWVRDIRDQCLDAAVPFYLKQWSGRSPRSLGRTLDGVVWDQMPDPPAKPPPTNVREKGRTT